MLIEKLLATAFVFAATAAGMVFSGGNAMAQDDGPKHLTLLGIPSATTAPAGLVFGQISHSFDLNSETQERTALSLGFGFGDADDGFGGQVTAVGASSSNLYDSFSYFGVKVARRLTSFENPTYVGLLVNRIAATDQLADEDPTASVMLTRVGTFDTPTVPGRTPYILTLGAGSHLRNESEDAGIFFGAGIGVSKNLGVSAAWSAEKLDLGASLRFDALENVRLSFVLSDALEQQNRRQMTVGLSWAFNTGLGR